MAETAAKTEPTTIVMLQDALGQTKAVRIGETEFPVLAGVPIPGIGQLNFTMTIGNIRPEFEPYEPKAEA